jgi:hypothetical protein
MNSIPTGESTVTLEDVNMFDLPVDGKAVTGVSEWYYNDLCPDYLGKTPIKPGSKAKKS